MAKSNKKTHKNDLKAGSKITGRSSSMWLAGRPGTQSQFRSGLFSKTKSSTCFRCVVPTPSGIAIFLRTREFRAVPIKEPKSVKSVVEKFRGKYGAGDVKKYYSKFDVAVLAEPV